MTDLETAIDTTWKRVWAEDPQLTANETAAETAEYLINTKNAGLLGTLTNIARHRKGSDVIKLKETVAQKMLADGVITGYTTGPETITLITDRGDNTYLLDVG